MTLSFNPANIPADTTDDREFFRWFAERRSHHEFPELERRLAALTTRLPCQERAAFERFAFRSAWCAATLRGPLPAARSRSSRQLYRALPALAAELRGLSSSLSLEGDVLLKQFQLGPFLMIPAPMAIRCPFEGKTRQASTSTLLAAWIAGFSRRYVGRIDWTMLEKLAAVSQISDVDSSSLRVSANRILKAVGARKLVPVGWPQDTGPTVRTLEAYIGRQVG